MRLLLFDIDGTLVRVNGRGREAVNAALSSLMSQPISVDGVTFSGRTDPAIVEAVLTHNDLPATDAMIEDVISTYVETMRDVLTPADVEVLPGVSDLLTELHAHPDVQLGLVTGNVEPIAYEKLSAHGLDTYFPVGAFGSDHAERNRLPELATRRAAYHTGHAFHPHEHTVIVGDTAHDIECARAVGAQAVAVCTGRYGRADLSQHDPDLLFDSLPGPSAFLQQTLAD
ncbi:HAD hydrolase-like protein [Salinibacter altiplanensis]|uniref:HAD hydrolase-like protein n=1 Tax=Salinibacter altiplanensis TaxID=1803181 RepID=UPI000C9EF027|nr:HAD hydrolase-like protein [Salinibacter altiplanensis]